MYGLVWKDQKREKQTIGQMQTKAYVSWCVCLSGFSFHAKPKITTLVSPHLPFLVSALHPWSPFVPTPARPEGPLFLPALRHPAPLVVAVPAALLLGGDEVLVVGALCPVLVRDARVDLQAEAEKHHPVLEGGEGGMGK